MNLTLITICTSRKKVPPHPQMCATNLPKGDQNHLLLTWKKRVQKSTDKIQAKDLYRGRGISEIRKIRGNTPIDNWIISAGLGLIPWSREVASYNLTISPSSEGSIQTQLSTRSTFCPREWWRDLNQELNGTSKPINDLIKNERESIFVISVSQTYLDFIYADLFSLDRKDLARVRLLGFNNPKVLPDDFRDLWMPYDDRFDGPDCPIPGTRSDFSQRVARHFIENILCENTSHAPSEHVTRVANFIKSMPPPVRIKRLSLTDEQIKKIITARWNEAKGSGSRMLRILRDKELVACDQGRFAALFRQIKDKKE